MDDLISRQAAIDAADRADYTGLAVEDVKKVTDEVVKEIKKLPSAGLRWIPCSETLPEENMWTLCQNNAGAMMIGKYDIEFGWMFPAYFDGIVAWQPLPEPWKGEDDEPVDIM